MKQKITTILILCLMISSLVPAFGIQSNYEPRNPYDYYNVIDEINHEFNTHITIPDEETLKEIMRESAQEFKQSLREAYVSAINAKAEEHIVVEGFHINDIMRSITEDIRQEIPITNGYLFLESQVFSSTGAANTYTYQKVTKMGSGWNDVNKEHFRSTTSASYVISSDKKTVTATYKGSMFKGSLDLLVAKTYIVDYKCN